MRQLKILKKAMACLALLVCSSAAVGEAAVSHPADSPERTIENGLWLNGGYLLYVSRSGTDTVVGIIRSDRESGEEDTWFFLRDLESDPDALTAVSCLAESIRYDENNLLVPNGSREALPCETCVLLNSQDLVTVQSSPDPLLEGMEFRRADSAELNDQAFVLSEGQDWWLEDTPFDSWLNFRPVNLENNHWFWIRKLPHGIYAFYEPYQDQGVISYLIPGEESALMWDTGMGIANIRECVEPLTELPVTVLNSHDHFDHTGGNYLFDRVMCYNIDSAIRTLTEGKSHEYLMEYVSRENLVNGPDDFSLESFARIGKAPTATVEDGQIIDLGGRKLEVMYTPGHSASSIMLIDEADGILFTGDTWYPGPLYAFLEDSSLPDYVRSMRRAEQVIRDRNIQWLFCSHNQILPGTELFFETADFLEDVLAGKVTYTVKDGMKKYTMNDLISLEMKAEEPGAEE